MGAIIIINSGFNDDLALLADYFESGAAREDMEAIMTNEERFAQCKLAIVYEWKDTFSLYALGLLTHGYLLECGKRGGLRKHWIGHIHEEKDYYAHLRDVYERAVAVRQPQQDEEWSDQDSRFITPALDLDTHNEQVLDTAYGPKETR